MEFDGVEKMENWKLGCVKNDIFICLFKIGLRM